MGTPDLTDMLLYWPLCAMTFEDQIRELAEEAVSCISEKQAVELIRSLQVLMHHRIESLRKNLTSLRAVGPVVQDPPSNGRI